MAAKTTSLKYVGAPFWPLKGEVHRRVKAARTASNQQRTSDFQGKQAERTCLGDEEAQGDLAGCSGSGGFGRVRHG